MTPARRIVAFVNVGHFIDHFVLLIFPTAVLFVGEDLGGDYGERLALATGSFLAFGLLSLPAGWLGDRWSRRHMFGVFFVGTGLAAIATGLAGSMWTLAAGLTVMGAFAAIYHPVGTAMLVAATNARGRDMGVNGVFGNVGVALAAVTTGFLAERFGWRAAFIVPGAVTVCVGIAYLFLVRGEPPRAAIAKTPGGSAGGSAAVLIAAAMFITVAAGGLTFNGIVITVPKLVADRAPAISADAALVGTVATLIYFTGALTQLVVGRLVEEVSVAGVFLVLGLMQLVGFAGAALLAGPASLAMAAVVLAAVYGQVVVNDMIIARAVPDSWRARAYAVRYVVGFTTAALALPLVALLHRAQTGLAPVYLVLAGCAAAIVAAAVVYALATRRAAATQPAE